MRVLLSAYACEPGKGSEPGVGWNLARELAKKVDLWVITRPNNREPIEASGEEWVHQVHWIYWDPPQWLTFWKKGGRGVQCFYMIWQIGLFRIAKRMVDEHAIDLCHHITFGRYWIPSRLSSLPVPFIFGPVGGGEESPPGLRSVDSLRGKIGNLAKNFISTLYPRLPWNRRLYTKALWTYAATPQTAEKLTQLGVRRMCLLPQSGITEDEFAGVARTNRRPDGPLRLVTACRLIHWKAVDLAIEAVALASQIIEVRLSVLQHGPEFENLKNLAKRLGVADIVEFRGRLPALSDVHQAIDDADALIHPATQEAFGQACLEALSLGTPVICLNWGGPGLIVDESCGFAIEPGTREETIQRLAAAMVARQQQIKAGADIAEACKKRAFGQFHWQSLCNTIIEQYHSR